MFNDNVQLGWQKWQDLCNKNGSDNFLKKWEIVKIIRITHRLEKEISKDGYPERQQVLQELHDIKAILVNEFTKRDGYKLFGCYPIFGGDHTPWGALPLFAKFFCNA